MITPKQQICKQYSTKKNRNRQNVKTANNDTGRGLGRFEGVQGE